MDKFSFSEMISLYQEGTFYLEDIDSDVDDIEYYMNYQYQQPSINLVRDKNGFLHCFSKWACKLISEYDSLFNEKEEYIKYNFLKKQHNVVILNYRRLVDEEEPSKFINVFLKDTNDKVKETFLNLFKKD